MRYINKLIQDELDNMPLDFEEIYEDKKLLKFVMDAVEIDIEVPQLLLKEHYYIECTINIIASIRGENAWLNVEDEDCIVFDSNEDKVSHDLDYNLTELTKRVNIELF